MPDDMNHPSTRLAYLQPRYLLSLPERCLRASAAVVGGAVFEAAEVALPGWLRGTKLYKTLVYRLLRIVVELLGGMEGALPPDNMEVRDLAVRKALGNVIELASFVAVGWSPLWLLAAASDLSGGTRAYLNAFVGELKSDRLLPEGEDIGSVEELLNALEESAGTAADMVDMPPLKVSDLKQSWQALKRNAARLPSAEQLTNLYQHMQRVAREEGRSLGEISALVAAGAVRAGLRMGSVHIFDYYLKALEAIKAEGWMAYARRVARPYALAGKSHFDPARSTYTERVLARWRGRGK